MGLTQKRALRPRPYDGPDIAARHPDTCRDRRRRVDDRHSYQIRFSLDPALTAAREVVADLLRTCTTQANTSTSRNVSMGEAWTRLLVSYAV